MACHLPCDSQAPASPDAAFLPPAGRDHRSFPPVQNARRRRSFRLQLGNGTERPFHSAERGIQQSLQRPHWTLRLGTTALPLLHGRSLQSLRRVFLRLGLGAADLQQPAFRAHLHSDLPDRPAAVRRSHRALVGANLGAAALVLVLVGALALGHDIYSAYPQPDLSSRARTPGVARHARLDSFWRALGRRRARESLHARVSSLLRPLDLEAKIQTAPAFI